MKKPKATQTKATPSGRRYAGDKGDGKAHKSQTERKNMGSWDDSIKAVSDPADTPFGEADG